MPCFSISLMIVQSLACDADHCILRMLFSAVPNAAATMTVNNILIKTSWNSSVTILCGPLCPTVSLQAAWQQHSGAAGIPMTLLTVESTNCPLSIGQENILAVEQIARCAQVRSNVSKHPVF